MCIYSTLDTGQHLCDFNSDRMSACPRSVLVQLYLELYAVVCRGKRMQRREPSMSAVVYDFAAQSWVAAQAHLL